MRFAPVLALILVAAPALAVAPSFTYAASDCAYAYWLVPTFVSAWRPHVPARFTMLGEPADATIAVVTFVECDFAVNGGRAARAIASDVGVMVQPPTGNLGSLDFYWLWQVTDSSALAELDAAWGVPSAVGELQLDDDRLGLLPVLSNAQSGSESAFGSYGGYGHYLPSHEAQPGVSNWWRETEGGLLRFEQVFMPGLHEIDGVGEIHAEITGPLAALLPRPALAQASISYTDLTASASFIPE